MTADVLMYYMLTGAKWSDLLLQYLVVFTNLALSHGHLDKCGSFLLRSAQGFTL